VTVARWLEEAARRLEAAGSASPRLEALVLAAHAAGRTTESLLANPGAEAPPLADRLLARAAAGEPLAYIVGRREFWGREFAVGPAVLIPRQETETLVSAALHEGPQGRADVLDLGTGSGCLAVTLALERPAWRVCAGDVSEDALAVARGNAARLGAEVEFRQGNWAKPWAGGSFDLVVANPPYVATGAALSTQVAGHEPHLALFAGPDGLKDYEALAAGVPAVLAQGGALVLEAGDGMAAQVEAVLGRAGWRTVRWYDDLGGMPRAGVFRPGAHHNAG
jgi:release factor glutamine methyltransferase